MSKDIKSSKNKKFIKGKGQTIPGLSPGNSQPYTQLRYIHFVFTLHVKFNRVIDSYDYDKKLNHLIEKLNEQRVHSAIVSLEYGKCGNRPHFQGYIRFFKRSSIIEWFDLSQTHFEPAMSNQRDNIRYISGIDKEYEAPGNVILQKNITWPSNIREAYDNKIKRRTLITGHQLYDWQKQIIKYYAFEGDDRSIIWIYEKKGCSGKTSFAKYLSYFYGGLPVGGRAVDIKYAIKAHFDATERYPQLILVDIPRADENYVSYSAIENVKDSIFFSTKYESEGCKSTFSPHIIVFANFPPNKEKLSKDRWIIFHLKRGKLIQKYGKKVLCSCDLDSPK